MTKYSEKPWLKWYDKTLSPEIEIPDITFLSMIEKGINHNPDHPAIHFLGKTITFRELDTLSCRFSSYLAKAGCKKGDVVGINLPNLPQYVIALVGCIRSGCIITGVSPLLTPRELIHHINDSGAKVVITMDFLLEDGLGKITLLFS